MTKKIVIAKVSSPHGIKGEVKIVSYGHDPLDVEKYPLFDENGNTVKLKISNKNKTQVGSTSSGDAILIAKIDGVDNRNDAEDLRQKDFFVNRDDFEDLDDGEFYYSDLIGLNVIEKEKTSGKVKNIYDFGAGIMLEIEFKKADKDRNLEKIETFPFKNEYFGKVDIKKGTIELIIPQITTEKL